jgi:hypothetical protein
MEGGEKERNEREREGERKCHSENELRKKVDRQRVKACVRVRAEVFIILSFVICHLLMCDVMIFHSAVALLSHYDSFVLEVFRFASTLPVCLLPTHSS